MGGMKPIFESLVAHLEGCSWPQVAELAQKSDVPYHTVAKIKRGETLNPRIETVQKLIDQIQPKRQAKQVA
jgi:predicted transcriptional regulator